MTANQYIENICEAYKRGSATEHTYRSDLKQLVESTVPNINATNEPKRQQCGAPDYILTKKDIPIGFIEAKDIGDNDLEGAKKTGNKEQFDRYKTSLGNIIFTDYLDFYFYNDGKFITKIKIGKIENGKIIAITENFASFENLLKDFCLYVGQNIKNSQKLAEMMAGKARLLAEVIEKALISDVETSQNSTLKDQMDAFRQILIHDITPKGFADVYAQTICYGMFAARLHDPTLQPFSRQEAAELIPKSNPFLRKLFSYIAGPDLDDRIKWIIDSLVDIFLACNVAEILKNYGKATKMEDPIIHFYETFLSEYDPALRKSRGVWYTPQPVVNFIVRAVDEILKSEFDLPQGLADTTKTKITVDVQGKKTEKQVHKVQILDPATGTGTFLAETIKQIHTKFSSKQGIWSNYVESDLLPRLHGFELLMASYAMAHLKLDLLLTETGYTPSALGRVGVGLQRLRVFLTNSLEKSHPDANTLFANWLSAEANEANHIKRDAPVMCVMGNPPYSVSSQNKGEWIGNLIGDYKKNMLEKNIQPLSDDYIKFIRLGQHFIDKNGSGVLAYISNNSFVDGIIHRQMRKNLLESFDKIYIVDLHGNSKKKEVCADGSPDQNVFDIMQGVSINIFVKTGKKQKNELGQVFHYDLQGKRQLKYDFLLKNTLKTVSWNTLINKSPNYFFVKKIFDTSGVYEKGFKLNEFFVKYNAGTATGKDDLYVDLDRTKLISKLTKNKITFNKNEIVDYNYRVFDKRFFVYDNILIQRLRDGLMQHLKNENICLITTKILSSKFYAHTFLSTIVGDRCVISNRGQEANYYFPLYIYPKPIKEIQDDDFQNKSARYEEARVILESTQKAFVQIKKMFNAVSNPDTDLLGYYNQQKKHVEKLQKDAEKAKNLLETSQTKPLFVFENDLPKANFDEIIANKIAENLGLIYNPSPKNLFETGKDLISNTVKNTKAMDIKSSSSLPHPIDILDYIYAVLHSPKYRERYKEFLKIDFPIVPFSKDIAAFWQLVKLGAKLRQIHLMETSLIEKHLSPYPKHGDNKVGKVHFENNKVYINYDKNINSNDSKLQYFDTVSQTIWDFYIGGYQPAQKWLKDRKDQILDFDDILHYQKIIAALSETNRLMQEIDTIEM